MEIFREWVSENAEKIRKIAADRGWSIEQTIKNMLNDVVDSYSEWSNNEGKQQ